MGSLLLSSRFAAFVESAAAFFDFVRVLPMVQNVSG